MRTLLSISLLFYFASAFGQIPSGYYNNVQGLSGEDLQQALHNIIDNHNSLSYGDLWDAYPDTDKKSNGKVWDMYSDVPGGNPPYQFNFFSDQCGNYGQEGDCYNREHSFPRSWFGGTVAPMNTDLFQVYPTDGYVNGRRGNYPYGVVGNASWTSQNGCKLGTCITPGYSGTVFEPIDAYKGDFARTYFYMATRYYGEDGNWPGSPMVNGSQPKEWALNMLVQWHENDPVSQKEIDRNDAVYDYQNNRNPYIDHPDFVGEVWFTTTLDEELLMDEFDFSIYPNPASDYLHVHLSGAAAQKELTVSIVDQAGRTIISRKVANAETLQIDITTLSKGFYFCLIRDTRTQWQVGSKVAVY